MWKLTLLVAIVANLATTYGVDYFDKVSVSMNEAINARYSCSDYVIDEYSEECSEIETREDSDDILKAYYDAVSTLAGVCIYELTRVNGKETQLTSVEPLVGILGQLSLNAIGSTRTQLQNLVNLNDSTQVRYMVPKANADVEDDSGEFISRIRTVAFTSCDKYFSDQFISCFDQMAHGDTQVIDYSNPTEAVGVINSWFSAHTSLDEELVCVDDIRNNTGVIFGTYHYAEIKFDQFAFTEEKVMDFKTSEDSSVSHNVRVGKGQAKVAYNDELEAQVVEIALKGGKRAVLIKPELGYNYIAELLFTLRDGSIVGELTAESEYEDIELTMPLFEDNYGKENFVQGLKLANQLTSMYYRQFDGFTGIFDNESGHVSHMFHKMHLKVNLESDYSTSSETVKAVDILSPFVYYILNECGTPMFIGTYHGFGINS